MTPSVTHTYPVSSRQQRTSTFIYISIYRYIDTYIYLYINIYIYILVRLQRLVEIQTCFSGIFFPSSPCESWRFFSFLVGADGDVFWGSYGGVGGNRGGRTYIFLHRPPLPSVCLNRLHTPPSHPDGNEGRALVSCPVLPSLTSSHSLAPVAAALPCTFIRWCHCRRVLMANLV